MERCLLILISNVDKVIAFTLSYHYYIHSTQLLNTVGTCNRSQYLRRRLITESLRPICQLLYKEQSKLHTIKTLKILMCIYIQAVMRSEIGMKPRKESVKITKPNEETGNFNVCLKIISINN